MPSPALSHLASRLCRSSSSSSSAVLRGHPAPLLLHHHQQHHQHQHLQQRRSLCRAGSAAGSEPAGPGAPRVVVMGGGFGGLYTAVRLSSLFWQRNKMPQITLVDKSDRFVFKPLLYELLNGGADEAEVAPPFLQLLAPYPVRYVQARVASVEMEEAEGGGRVKLEDGTDLEYDWLVVALGAQSNDRGIPGVKDLAVPFNTLEDAQRTKAALDDVEARAAQGSAPGTVMIVGAGYAGVELAASVAERLRARQGGGSNVRVQLLTPGSCILEGLPAGQREAASNALDALGVEVVTGMRVLSLERTADPAAAPTAATVNLEQVQPSAAAAADAGPSSSGSSSRAVDLVLWTAGQAPSTRDMTQRSGFPFPCSGAGSVLTEPTLRVRGHGRVFALGDVSLSGPGAEAPPLPATAQVAFQQADYAAWNLWASINGRPLLPFRYQHLGTMMGLGATNGAVALPIPVPPPLSSSLQATPLGPLLSAMGVKVGSGGDPSGVTLEGPLAAVARRAAYLYRQPTNEQRLNVAANWLSQAGGLAGALLGALPGMGGQGGR